MPDQFEIQRKLDHASEEPSQLHEQMEDIRDEGEERKARLIKLDETHYFDPHTKQVLFKSGAQFKPLGHEESYHSMASEQMEEEARRKGYTPIHGGLFWDHGMKQLYVKQGGRYVLYAQDRRKEERRDLSPPRE